MTGHQEWAASKKKIIVKMPKILYDHFRDVTKIVGIGSQTTRETIRK